jgi:alkyl hydroperoxide reductase subunit AhpC
MGLRLGDTAPDFVAQTTGGTIRFHEWIGDSWAVLFSHPKDFTPICTTELGSVAKLSPEFQRRNVKLIGLSVDSLAEHARWVDDIEETQGVRPDFPIIADTDLNVSKLYGMLEADAEGDAASRCAHDNRTVRSTFVIDPEKRVRLITMYPMQTGRNVTEMLRAVDSIQLTTRHPVATPASWQPGEDVMISLMVSDEKAKALYGDFLAPTPYMRIIPQPAR